MFAAAEDTEGRVVEYLLAHKADPMIRNKRGLNSVHYAAASGNSEGLIHLFEFCSYSDLLEQQLQQHHHLAAAGSGCETTPVHLASANGHQDILVFLFSKHKNPNCLDSKGRTPLHMAAKSGHTDVVEFLLERGANVAVHERVSGLSPTHLAAAHGNSCCLKLLLANTEDATCVDARDHARHLRTPLAMAVENGYIKSAELLLQHGAHIDAHDASGRTPLFRASVMGQEECVEMLLEHGGGGNGGVAGADKTWKDNDGLTAFHVAAAVGQITVLGLLVESLDDAKAVQKLIDNEG
jgi:ankyrin repeat protein